MCFANGLATRVGTQNPICPLHPAPSLFALSSGVHVNVQPDPLEGASTDSPASRWHPWHLDPCDMSRVITPSAKWLAR